MSMRNGHLQFQEWTRQYGPVFSLMLGTQVLIVLSSQEATRGQLVLTN